MQRKKIAIAVKKTSPLETPSCKKKPIIDISLVHRAWRKAAKKRKGVSCAVEKKKSSSRGVC
jgi:hypothetical protein